LGSRTGFGGLHWALRHVKFWHWYRVLGRLQSWRLATRLWGRVRVSRLVIPPWPAAATVFEHVDLPAVIDNLHRQGFHAGLQMPHGLVAELVRHAEQNDCRRDARDPERFLIGQVTNGRSPLGNVVAVADVDADTCPATARIANDATLTRIVQAHLGYAPTMVATRLYWSPSASLTDDERRWNGQTIDYHYDIERRPTLYLYFYLSDADCQRGAHVVVAGSHKPKPLRLKWASTRQPDRIVLARYGADKVVFIEGTSGFGFFEDPACFHKVLPPTSCHRLMLQLRYS
jgi:hypothetical protein